MATNPTLKLSGFQIEIQDDRFAIGDGTGGENILSPADSRLLRAFVGAADLPQRDVVVR